MRYWFDTEFIEDGKTIDLISIGIVAEDGREYYAISNEFDASKAMDWHQDNVLVHLPPKTDKLWMSRKQIAQEIQSFVGKKPAFWAYYADYDWVALCQLFGRMIDLPKSWPMYCRDIKQIADEMGSVKLPKQTEGEHNALEDARWNYRAWRFLQDLKGKI